MSSPNLEASVAERLGGRWAISWQAFVITTPLAVTVLALGASDPSDIPLWLSIGVIATFATTLWVYAMHRTVFRDRARSPVRWRWSVTLALVSASLYMLVAIVVGYSWNLVTSDVLLVQFIPLFVISVSWTFLLTLVIDSQWRYRVQRQELIEQAVQQQLAKAQEIELLKEIRESVSSDVGQLVRSSSERLIERIDRLMHDGQSDFRQLAVELRATAESTVRPLSHELEERSRRTYATPGFFAALGNIVRHQPFRPLAVSIIYAITTTPQQIIDYGVTTGLGLLLVTVTFIFAIMSGLNSAMRRWPDYHASIFLSGLIVVQAPTLLLSPLSAEVTGESVTASGLLVTIVVGTFIVFATSSFGSWNRSRKEVIADLRREVDEETIAILARGDAIARATREAAVILHGSVQTQLHACALTIEAAMRNGDLVEVNRALVHARALLEQPDLLRSNASVVSLRSSIDERIAQWRGLLGVSVSIDAATEELSGVVAGHVADVVEEGIANAFHHGSAAEVSVAITCNGDELTVIVLDNGTGPSSGVPGLGSRLYAAYGAQWSLTAGASGTCLTVEIPVSINDSGTLRRTLA